MGSSFMLITRTSPSGRSVTLDVPCTPEQYRLWESGVLIQDAMPQVPAPLREFLTSGIPPDEWDTLLGSPDADEDYEEEDEDVCPECARSYGPHFRGRCTHGTSTGDPR